MCGWMCDDESDDADTGVWRKVFFRNTFVTPFVVQIIPYHLGKYGVLPPEIESQCPDINTVTEQLLQIPGIVLFINTTDPDVPTEHDCGRDISLPPRVIASEKLHYIESLDALFQVIKTIKSDNHQKLLQYYGPVEEYSCFHSGVTVENCTHFLPPGTYLLRPSSKGDAYTLSFKGRDKSVSHRRFTKHFTLSGVWESI